MSDTEPAVANTPPPPAAPPLAAPRARVSRLAAAAACAQCARGAARAAACRGAALARRPAAVRADPPGARARHRTAEGGAGDRLPGARHALGQPDRLDRFAA